MTEDILYHETHKKALSNHFLENDWVWLYKKRHTIVDNEDIYYEYCSYLATPINALKSLKSAHCDIKISSPVALMGDYSYHTHAVPGFEHLVVVREFNHTKPAFQDIRITDEIIFYHRLFDRKDESGNVTFYSVENDSEIPVCEISHNSVRILGRYLSEFMAAKQMDLVCTCTSEVEFDLDKVKIPFNIQYTPKFTFIDVSPNSDSKCMLCIAHDNKPVQSWFNGKTVFRHISLKQIIDGMNNEINYIVGTDENGLLIFSSGETSPYTPVFFRKEIIGLYNGMHDSIIEPLRISTPSFSLRCDNDNDGYIIAFLKDIQDLPYSDQYKWRAYNIPPDNKNFSNIFQKSILEGNWNGVVKSVDFIFRDTFDTLCEKWQKKFARGVFKPLNGVQSNAPLKICTLVTNDYTALKNLVENLVLSLQESFCNFSDITPKLNFVKEKKVNGELAKVVIPEPPIDYFERVCLELGLDCQQFHEYLKMLQALRSNMLHRNPSKDNNGFKDARVYFGMNDEKSNTKYVSFQILQKGIEAMNSLISQL